MVYNCIIYYYKEHLQFAKILPTFKVDWTDQNILFKYLLIFLWLNSTERTPDDRRAHIGWCTGGTRFSWSNIIYGPEIKDSCTLGQ